MQLDHDRALKAEQAKVAALEAHTKNATDDATVARIKDSVAAVCRSGTHVAFDWTCSFQSNTGAFN